MQHPSTPQLIDRFGRKITYVRLSLTERCNFRCVYCMPAQGDPFSANAELLSWDEIERLARWFAQRGVTKLRLTGGEPLVRHDLPGLVDRLARIPGIEHIALTTNGFLLKPLASALADAGLTSINLSLDTLDPERFAAITRTGSLERVIDGLDAALAAGIHDIKLNAVMVRGLNDDEFPALIRFAQQRGVVLRFIEVMPIGMQTIWGEAGEARCISARELRELLATRWTLSADGSEFGAGPARYWRLRGPDMPDEGYPVGIIGAVTECFCEACNRLRITATGGLRACLADDEELSLRDILRSPLSPQDQEVLLEQAVGRALEGKKERHRFDLEAGGVTTKAMNAIGG